MVKEFIQTILQTQSAYRQIIYRKMREHNIDISFEMLQIMRKLAEVDKTNQQELANKIYKDKSNLSYLIKNMEKRGLITKVEDESDRRNKIVTFTEEGKIVHAQIRKLIDEVYELVETQVNSEHLSSCIEYMNEFNKTIGEK